MQVVTAGSHKLLQLELDREVLETIAKQAGFDLRAEETKRQITLDLHAQERQAPLLLFDAADPANLGWFSRCNFYVDGNTGNVLQTPISLANHRDRSGHASPHSVRLQVTKELPVSFKMPGRRPVNERVVYGVVNDFLHALLNVGVGVCGKKLVQPLAGRTEPR